MANVKYTETTEQADIRRRKEEAERNKNSTRFGVVKDPKDSPLNEGVYEGTDPDYQTRLYVELDKGESGDSTEQPQVQAASASAGTPVAPKSAGTKK